MTLRLPRWELAVPASKPHMIEKDEALSRVEEIAACSPPTPREIDLARRMCRAYQASEKDGQGAAGWDGFLVDAASLRIFETVIERARLTGRS